MKTHLPKPSSPERTRAGGLRVLSIVLLVVALGPILYSLERASLGAFVFGLAVLVFSSAASRAASRLDPEPDASSRSPRSSSR